jgi:hypothetical protein
MRNMQQRLDAARLWKELETPFGRRPRRWADAALGVQIHERTRDYRAPRCACAIPSGGSRRGTP